MVGSGKSLCGVRVSEVLLLIAPTVGQLALMPRLLRDPLAHTPWYNATGTSLYVFGMLAAALGLGGVLGL